MIRRCAVVLLLLAAVGCVSEKSSQIRSAEPPSRLPSERPAWTKRGIVMAGNWEPLTAMRRRGGQSIEALENWPLERSDEVARKLQQAGVNLVITNFHKGFGLKTEAEDIEATRLFIKSAHKRGLRVGGYIGGTLMLETLCAEEPDARNWGQINEFGAPIYYNLSSTYRIAACRNNPGYRAFVRKLLRLGIEDLKLDLIHLDQMGWWNEPNSCRCNHCRRLFRQWLQRRYTDAQLKLRFGFSRLDDVVPPPLGRSSGPILMPELGGDPLMQDWSQFRSASIAERFGEYDSFIRSLNSEVALDGNPFFRQGINNGFLTGLDLQQYLQHGDVMWTEDGHHASWTADGRLLSKIRVFKSARKMGKSVFMYTGGGEWGIHDPASPDELRLAEALAYNDMNLGMVGHVTPDGVSLTSPAERYISFFHSHAKELANTEIIADAALLRTFSSIEFNPARSLFSTTLFEQTLIQSRIPFDIIFDRHLKDLRKYKVLILANQDALSDEQVRDIRAFVSNGGGLVATEETSLLTGWRLRRRSFGLADLFGVDQPIPDDQPGKAIQRRFGRGRVVYVPRIESASSPPPPQMSYYVGSQQWKLPKNYRELAGLVTWAADGQLTATIEAPVWVTAEFAQQPSSNTWLLHLVNYNFTKPVGAIPVSLRIPTGFRLKAATLETPDKPGRETLRVDGREGVITFRVPCLKVYDLILLSLERS
jgi:hypothetical protein